MFAFYKLPTLIKCPTNFGLYALKHVVQQYEQYTAQNMRFEPISKCLKGHSFGVCFSKFLQESIVIMSSCCKIRLYFYTAAQIAQAVYPPLNSITWATWVTGHQYRNTACLPVILSTLIKSCLDLEPRTLPNHSLVQYNKVTRT